MPSSGAEANTRRDVVIVTPMPADPDWSIYDEVPEDVPIYVPDDSDGNLSPPPRPNVTYFGSAAQKEILGKHYEAIPRHCAAIRNFGHYLAFAEGFDVVVCLDYDCRVPPGWLDTHLDALRSGEDLPAIESEMDGGWVNSINAPGYYARGFPFEQRNAEDAEMRLTTRTGEVKLHMGMWRGVVDLNGLDRWAYGAPDEPGLWSPEAVVAGGPLPLCSMNVAFRADLVPAYFFPPDVYVEDGTPGGWQLSRHDDIWSGYILQRILDRRGELLSFGPPIVDHERLTKKEHAVKVEHYMHLLQRDFCATVDTAVAGIEISDYATMYADFADGYLRALHANRALPAHYRGALLALGEAFARWAAIFV